MRVVGYVRESRDPDATRPTFAQQEELRRWAADHGHDLVAVCQDRPGPGGGRPLERDGYLSMLGVLAAGGVDAVLLPGIVTLSDDHIIQEILLWDLRARGARVLSTVADDAEIVGDQDPAATRLLIRDVLARVEEHARGLGRHPIGRARPAGGAEVVVELLEAIAAAPEEEADREEAAGA